MQFMTVEEIAHAAHADHEVGEEIAPGVVIERRTILRIGLSAIALAALAGAGGTLAGCAQRKKSRDGTDEAEMIDAGGSLEAADVVAQLRAQAKTMIAAPVPDEEMYVRAVTALLARMHRPECPADAAQPKPGDYRMDRLAYLPPVACFHIKMAPRAVISLHDHRHYNGVLMGAEGAARVRNFDIVQPDGHRLDIAAGEVPEKGADFLIRRTQDRELHVGKLSTLTRDRDNIHQVEAGDDGCRMVDLFTYFRPEARSYMLHWDGKPVDRVKGLYKAAWA